jgi:calcium/calmodulin-dependent protein kinase I
LCDDDEMALQLEVEILSQIDHPNVVRLVEIFDEAEVLYLVMELMSGGELFDRIVEKEAYTEKEAAETLRPIVDAIRYCHEQDIIHRDLKPENLLYSSTDEKAIIKISDFGLARFVQGEFATTACGTPGYVAPEIIEGIKYGKEVDYWSIGIILYIMLCGFPPFYEEDNTKLFAKISKCQVEFPSPYWDKISDQAKGLILSLLVRDPSKRLTAD